MTLMFSAVLSSCLGYLVDLFPGSCLGAEVFSYYTRPFSPTAWAHANLFLFHVRQGLWLGRIQIIRYATARKIMDLECFLEIFLYAAK